MMYFFSLIISFLLAALFTPLVKKLALKLNITDQPGPRKIHHQPVALLGGLAIYLAFTSCLLIFLALGYIIDVKISGLQVLGIVTAVSILIIGGILDDIYNLKPAQQIIFPLLAVSITVLFGVKIQFVTNPFGGYLNFPLYTGVIFAFFWLLGMIYTTKFLDGLDGLVSGVTSIGSIIIFIVSLSWDVANSGTSYLALILAGSCLGFLIFNWHPAKIFLGEGGSVFCGYMLGVLSIISGSKIATALLIMGIPILDVAWVIIRRLIQGKSPIGADRKHLHFRLLDIGLSHRQAVLFLYSATAAFGLTSLFLHSRGKLIALFLLLLFMVVLAAGLFYIYQKKQTHGHKKI